jgi:hypothetical protein
MKPSNPPEVIWETSHEFYYKTSSPVTAAALADNLLGLEGLFRHGAGVLARLLDVPVKDSVLLVTGIELSSYKDSFLFRLVFGKGAAAEKKLEKLRETLRIKDMDGATLAKVMIGLAAVYGGWHLFAQQHAKAPDEAAALRVENSFNNMCVSINMEPWEMLALLDESIRNKEDLRKNVIRIFKPDGQNASGEVRIGGEDGFTIPADVSEGLPVKYEKQDAEEDEVPHFNVPIIIRALDLDKPEQGWWAVLPEMGDNRLPVVLGETIKPGSILPGKIFHADVSIHYKTGPNGSRRAKRVILHKKY